MLSSLLWLTAAASVALSAPAPSGLIHPRATADEIVDGTVPSSVVNDSALVSVDSTSSFSTSQVQSYIPYEWFAQATYCPPGNQANWSCKSCQAAPIKDFQVYASGGDGGLIQYWYVGWWPSGNSIIVAHEGTELNNTFAVLTDLNIGLTPLNQTLFPGAPKGVLAHLGFQKAHARTAETILQTIKTIVAQKGATQVVTVGHSLGGALALLDGVYLSLNLPSSVKVATKTLGQPRVGNAAFADFVDQTLPDLVRITNKRDVVPVIPPIIFGYRHSGGEKHINAQNVWNSCPGHDNLSTNCSLGQVLTQTLSFKDHLGPYAGGVMLGTDSCL